MHGIFSRNELITQPIRKATTKPKNYIDDVANKGSGKSIRETRVREIGRSPQIKIGESKSGGDNWGHEGNNHSHDSTDANQSPEACHNGRLEPHMGKLTPPDLQQQIIPTQTMSYHHREGMQHISEVQLA